MKHKNIIPVLIFFLLFLWFLLLFVGTAEADEDTTEMFVMASLLNGRAEPSKKSAVEARFDHGDCLHAFWWSDSHHWIEVEGGETGTVWVWWEYVTERTDEFTVWNDYGSKIKIRKEPFGRVISYLKKDGELIIDKVVLGWGHSDRGWIELKYVTEED